MTGVFLYGNMNLEQVYFRGTRKLKRTYTVQLPLYLDNQGDDIPTEAILKVVKPIVAEDSILWAQQFHAFLYQHSPHEFYNELKRLMGEKG